MKRPSISTVVAAVSMTATAGVTAAFVATSPANGSIHTNREPAPLPTWVHWRYINGSHHHAIVVWPKDNGTSAQMNNYGPHGHIGLT